MTNSSSDLKLLPRPVEPDARPAPDPERARAAERAAYIAAVATMLPGHLRRCGVGALHVEQITAGVQETEAVRFCRSWWDSGKTFLLLTGGVGSGKTLAACELFTRLTKPGGYEHIGLVDEWDGRAGRLYNAGELARIGLWGPEREVLEDAVDRPFLVLDDLGTELLTDPWRANLFRLIDQRWQRNRRTVITANLAPEVLKARYEPRIFDRMRDGGRAVFCGDKSMRGAREGA